MMVAESQTESEMSLRLIKAPKSKTTTLRVRHLYLSLVVGGHGY